MTDVGTQAERILLIHPGALGDLIQAFPAFGRIRRAFEKGRITLLVGEPFAAFARQTALFDEVVSFDADAAYNGGFLRKLTLLGRLAAQVRRLAPSRVGVLKGAPVYAALAFASGAPVRVGLTRGSGRQMLTTAMPIDPAQHREDRYLAVAQALGAEVLLPQPARWTSSGSSADLGEGTLIGIAPGGARNVKEEMPVRRWEAGRYAELAARLRARTPEVKIVLLGTSGDRREAEVVKRALPDDAVVDLVGRTSLSEVRAVIAQLNIFVGHDSGLLHVAATTSTPIAAIFGPTDPRVACPRGPHVRSLWNRARPAPCYDEVTGRLIGCTRDCCIDRISVDSVISVVDELTSYRAPGRAW